MQNDAMVKEVETEMIKRSPYMRIHVTFTNQSNPCQFYQSIK